jgi:hypothetical protein
MNTTAAVIHALVERWRAEGELLRHYGQESVAGVCELHAREVEAALASAESEPLTLTEAAAESGFSADHLGRLVRDGKLPNAGRSGAPRVRRADLPTKVREKERRPLASSDDDGYDPLTDARSLMSRR